MTGAAATAPTDHRPMARRAGFFSDLSTVARRALRLSIREPEAVLPALFIPLFFFTVNIGALQKFVEANLGGLDFKAFQLPVAILNAVTGVSRAGSLVTDIQDGYFDRLVLTPVRRGALLLGLMIADFALVCSLCLPVLGLGFLVGVRFETGLFGIVAFVLIAGLWGLAFAGFAYAIALKTGNPAAVNSSFLLFFPFLFLTTAFLPQEALTGWLETVAKVNPVTYILAAQRDLILVGWDGRNIAEAALVIAIVMALSQGLAFAALRGRLRRG
jgi:ABC-2 type transport system permease protein